MAKTNESVERVEDLKAQVKDLLGLDAMMDESVTKEMKDNLSLRLRTTVRSTSKR